MTEAAMTEAVMTEADEDEAARTGAAASGWVPAPIDPVPDPWPLHGLVLRTGRLELRPDDDASARELVTVLHDGVHRASVMPFREPWTEADPRYLGRGVLQYLWRERMSLSPEDWSVHFVVRLDGRVIGLQSVTATRFAVLREVCTGSYLGRHFQGQGHGTAMRAAVLAFAFGYLGATTARSEYFAGNAASAAVSARLGYRTDGTRLLAPRGERVVEQRMVLDAAGFTPPGPAPEVEGWTPELAGLLGAEWPLTSTEQH
ncbi:GNAT family N-acetyltransferase [Pseudonocardia phyllosphaerae]|uniref:GNAT family N-acetyltransferase n=1 Tax=Pseudonocardia phyllosphaerae TaxID=3390502 RepID=UPI0039781E3A